MPASVLETEILRRRREPEAAEQVLAEAENETTDDWARDWFGALRSATERSHDGAVLRYGKLIEAGRDDGTWRRDGDSAPIGLGASHSPCR